MPLEVEAQRFADELTSTVFAVVGDGCAPFQARTIGREAVAVRQDPATGIPLSLARGASATLTVRFRCTWSTSGDFLRVAASTFAVYYSAKAEGRPLFRYDYDRHLSPEMPRAHLQLHEGPELAALLMMSGDGTRRASRRMKRVDRGLYPVPDDLHFPLGGDRFRPCLEDVLQVLVTELGVRAVEGWRPALEAGRRRWRQRQLEAAVEDDPLTAAAKLERLGFKVVPPEQVPPPRDGVLTRL